MSISFNCCGSGFLFFPYSEIIGRFVFLSNVSFLHKIIRNQFGGMFVFTYKKNVIPLTPQKVLFNKDYKVTSLVKNNL